MILPVLVDRILSTESCADDYRYDAVLVDEGQDFRLNWWNALRKICRSDGEMLLVADPTQDLYGTARATFGTSQRFLKIRGRSL